MRISRSKHEPARRRNPRRPASHAGPRLLRRHRFLFPAPVLPEYKIVKRDYPKRRDTMEKRANYMTTSPFDGELRDGGHWMQVRVFYEDTDFSSAVYHASYLRFME